MAKKKEEINKDQPKEEVQEPKEEFNLAKELLKEIKNLAKEPESFSSKTYAEHIAENLKGKLIEIMIGESYEELQLDQLSSNYPAVVVGSVESAMGNVLVLNCVYIENRTLKFGKKIYLNDYSIQYLSELDGKCSLEDLLLRSKDTKQILKAYLENKY